MKKFLSLMLVLGVVFSIIGTGPFSVFADEAEDQRVYIHGVNFVKLDGKDLLIFSSDRYPPSEPVDTDGEWIHDVYYSEVDPATAEGILPADRVHTLVNAELAQEPASAAVNSEGRLVVTCEDAEWNEWLDQTYGMWNSDLTQAPVVPYGVQLMTGGGSDPENPNQGGHSGHVAASGNKFLVTFCDGWADGTEEDDDGNIIQHGGGVDGLGEGEDIFARIINADGSMGPLLQTSVGEDYNEWWPLVAGSDENWLQVYQRYEGEPGVPSSDGGTLWGAITTAAGGGTVGAPFQIAGDIKYYYYDVTYIPAIGKYLVTGTRTGGGFMTLIDKQGHVTATKTGLPETVREAKTVINATDDGVTAVYPTFPTGAAIVKIEGNSIDLENTIEGSHEWNYMGTAGIFASDSEVLFATGTTAGIRFVRFDTEALEEVGSGSDEDDYSFLENVALNEKATAWATSEYTDESHPAGTFSAARAIDGDYGTRWDSLEGTGPEVEKPQVFQVDLGDVYAVRKIVIHWDSCVKDYKIQFSSDGSDWEDKDGWDASKDVYTVNNGEWRDEDVIDAPGYARYIQFVGTERVEEDWGFSFTEFEIYGYKPYETVAARWKDNKDAAVTYGFAGAFRDTLDLMLPLMEEHDIKGTGYIIPNEVGVEDGLPTWDEYGDIAAENNENIRFGYFGPSRAGHFVNRDGSWGGDALSEEDTVADIVYGKGLIEDQLGYSVDVMMGNDYYTGSSEELTDIMDDYFLATMHGDFEPYINRWNTTDYYSLGGAVVYPYADWGTPAETPEGLRACINEAIAQKGLLAIEAREVYDDVSEPDYEPYWWGATPLSFYEDNFAYLDANSTSIWNDTLGNIVKYMRERDALTHEVLSPDGDGAVISFGLPADMVEKEDSFHNPVYDRPVTVKTSVPNNWLSATVRQGTGDESDPIVPFIENGKKWITYDIVPGAGEVYINALAKGDYVSTGKIKASVVVGSVNVADSMRKIEEGDKFVVTLTNSTFRESITKDNILLTGLPDGLTYDAAVSEGSRDTLEITLSGASVKPMTRLYNLALVIKGNSVNELEATNSKTMILQIVGNPGNTGDSIVTEWKDNKTAAYTATYDDGIIDSLERFLTLHEKYGFKATIALVPQFIDREQHPDDNYYQDENGNDVHVSMGSWEDFRELVGTGYFEVASHMLNHAMKTVVGEDGKESYVGRDVPTFLAREGEEALEQDFADSKARLEQELGVPVDTLIYPHYDTNEAINTIAAKVYEAARTGGDEMDGNSPDGSNYYSLYSKTFYDRVISAEEDTTADEAKEWLDAAIEKGYWLITVGHGNNYEGWGAPPLSVYDGFYGYVAENRDIVWVDTMGTIGEYMKERNNSTIRLISSTATSYAISLTDTLDNSIYDQTLTVRTNIPANWAGVRVKQGGAVLASRIETGDGGKYVYYNALPDAGDIVISKVSGGNNGGNNTGNNGAGQNPGNTTAGNVITARPVVDLATGSSTTTVGADDLNNAFKNSNTVVIKIPAAEGISKYAANLPASVLSSGNPNRSIRIETDIGTISVPGNMFGADEVGDAQSIGISIASAGQMDGKPVVELNVTIDGKPVSWSNPDAPVTISIPYTPTEEEKANPEHITVWYIDGSGNLLPVTSARYDPETGRVTFEVTHFSKYAVAYVEKTFDDIGGYGWAKNAIEVMASKGVVNGTTGSSFFPSANITRADFILLLTKALNLSARADGNFPDVNPSAYYYEAVGVAKKLGITAGVGNNKFDPNAFITRQEMMTLADRALSAAKRGLPAGTEADLGRFGDREKIAGYALPSVVRLVKSGIATGDGANINPLGNTTRAEAAVIIYRIYNAGLN